ncbi:MAG: hypothetical protein ACQERD_00935 [Campylobacterota bacterium]
MAENKKQMTQEELIAQAVAQAERKMELKIQQREMNTIKLGATVVNTELIRGREIVDKQTGEVKKDSAGNAMRYPDKFKAQLLFNGGNMETSITEDDFSQLQPNKKYLCEGYMGEIKVFGNVQIAPIFTSFTQL